MTPPELYASMEACARQDRPDDALTLYALGGTFARFDMLRVADRTAHQVHTILLMQYRDAVPREQWAPVVERLSVTDADDAAKSAFCARIRAHGPPTYHPQYMISHGMGAFLGNGGSPFVEGFEPERGWSEAMAAYMRCPE